MVKVHFWHNRFSDTGLTGRKLISSGFGANSLHGGGAVAGKDWTKPDRGLVEYFRFEKFDFDIIGRAEIDSNLWYLTNAETKHTEQQSDFYGQVKKVWKGYRPVVRP